MTTNWTIAEHGESKEKQYWPELRKHCPTYQEFWRIHVVPLTYRVIDEQFLYLRREPPKILRELANLSYQAFFHLGKAFEIHKELATPKFGESLFDFYGRLCAALERGSEFSTYVDRCCKKYAICPKGYHWHKDQKYLSLNDSLLEIQAVVRAYRNKEVHRTTKVLANGKMPRKDKLDKYSDFSAVIDLLTNPQLVEDEFVPVHTTTQEHLHKASQVLDSLWNGAVQRMEPLLKNDAYLRDIEIAGRERELARRMRLQAEDPKSCVVWHYLASSE
jgi:hypothetical protein